MLTQHQLVSWEIRAGSPLLKNGQTRVQAELSTAFLSFEVY